MTINSPFWIEGQQKVMPRRAPTSASTATLSCAKRVIPRPRSGRCERMASSAEIKKEPVSVETGSRFSYSSTGS